MPRLTKAARLEKIRPYLLALLSGPLSRGLIDHYGLVNPEVPKRLWMVAVAMYEAEKDL